MTIPSLSEMAEFIVKASAVLNKVESLVDSQDRIFKSIDALEKRVRDLEVGLRVAHSEITLAAVKEANEQIRAVQGDIFSQLRDISVMAQLAARASQNGSGVSIAASSSSTMLPNSSEN